MSRHVHGPQLVRKEKMRVCSCRFPTTMLTRAQDRPWGACPLVRLQPCMRVDYPIRPLLAALTARRLERPRRPLRRKGQRIARGRPRAAWRRPPRLKLPLAAGMEAAGSATPITAAAARSHPRAAPPRPPPDRPAPPPARGLRRARGRVGLGGWSGRGPHGGRWQRDADHGSSRTSGRRRTAPRCRRRGGCVAWHFGVGRRTLASASPMTRQTSQTLIMTQTINLDSFHQADHVRPRVLWRRPRRRVLSRPRSTTGRCRPRAALQGRPSPRP